MPLLALTRAGEKLAAWNANRAGCEWTEDEARRSDLSI
jgi:hypothetical protein